jgi:hypothetical protein
MGISWNRPDNWYEAYLHDRAKEVKEAKEAWTAERLARAELIDKDKEAADEDPLGDFREWLGPN